MWEELKYTTVIWSRHTSHFQILMNPDLHKLLHAQHGSQMELKSLSNMGLEISTESYPSQRVRQMGHTVKSMNPIMM